MFAVFWHSSWMRARLEEKVTPAITGRLECADLCSRCMAVWEAELPEQAAMPMAAKRSAASPQSAVRRVKAHLGSWVKARTRYGVNSSRVPPITGGSVRVGSVTKWTTD